MRSARLGVAIVLVTGLLAVPACDDSSGPRVKRPFVPRPESARWEMNHNTYTGNTGRVEGGFVGTTIIDGKEYGRLQAGNFDQTATPEGVEVWVDWERDRERVTVVGGEVHHPLPGVSQPGSLLISGTTNEPVVIDLNPPVGEPRIIEAAGTAVLGDPSVPGNHHEIEGVVSYTLEEKDVTVETSIGLIPGCRRFVGSTDAYGQNLEAEVYYHPTKGVVAGHINWPPPYGTAIDLMGISDLGDPDSGVGDIQALGVIGPGDARFRLSTYDVNNDLDADKDRHAKMLLEVRWLDEDKARTDKHPEVIEEFGVSMGYFPSRLVPSPISFFHPDENGQGYTFWVALVDQAAKNLPSQGVSYHIEARPTAQAEAQMRVTARIVYHKVP